MPIKNLSEEVRMPRLGKIHLGIKVKNAAGVEYPQKTEYFVLPKENSDYQRIVDLFGEKPKALRILIPVEDEELWASQYYKMYDMTRGLICKGDGEMAMRMIDVKTGTFANKTTETVTMKEWTCAGKECPEYQAKKCGETMNLRFILPEVPGLGVWQIDTGSINSILNINSCAKMIKAAFGRISMVPLSLTLEPIDVNNPETGKKQKVFVLNLRSTVTMAQLADVAREQSKTFLLETPDWDDIAEQKAEQDIEALWGDDSQRPAPDEQTGKQDTVAEAPKEKQSEFDADWLMDELKQLNWKEATVKSFLFSHYKVNIEKGNIVEIVSQLTKEHREDFFKYLADRKVMA
jgi:hypothetical protein